MPDTCSNEYDAFGAHPAVAAASLLLGNAERQEAVAHGPGLAAIPLSARPPPPTPAGLHTRSVSLAHAIKLMQFTCMHN